MKCTVAAGGGKSAVFRVEGDGVDRVDVADVAVVLWGLAVAFEGEVVSIKQRRLV